MVHMFVLRALHLEQVWDYLFVVHGGGETAYALEMLSGLALEIGVLGIEFELIIMSTVFNFDG